MTTASPALDWPWIEQWCLLWDRLVTLEDRIGRGIDLEESSPAGWDDDCDELLDRLIAERSQVYQELVVWEESKP